MNEIHKERIRNAAVVLPRLRRAGGGGDREDARAAAREAREAKELDLRERGFLVSQLCDPEVVADGRGPGTRRLRDLSRDIQRPLESRLYHLRRVYALPDEVISRELDLHPDDLDALAATGGMI